MFLVVGLLRVVLGIAAIGLALLLYLKHRDVMTGNTLIPLDYYDYHYLCAPPLMVVGIVVIALIGVLALSAGLYGITHWPQREPAPTPKPKSGAA